MGGKVAPTYSKRPVVTVQGHRMANSLFRSQDTGRVLRRGAAGFRVGFLVPGFLTPGVSVRPAEPRTPTSSTAARSCAECGH